MRAKSADPASTAAPVPRGATGEERVDLDSERVAELIGHEERGPELTAFETRDVVRREPGEFRELRLRPPEGLARAAYGLADASGELLGVLHANERLTPGA